MSEDATPADSGFEVKERRRFAASSGSESSAPSAPSSDAVENVAGSAESPDPPIPDSESQSTTGKSEDQPAEQPEEENGEEAIPQISVPQFLAYTLTSLYQLAWLSMGLLGNPATGKIEVNLQEARLAVDSYAALLPLLAPHMDASTRREFETQVTNLRLNYAQQSQKRQG